MKKVYLVITPKTINTQTISLSGKTYTRTRTAQLYFCMVNVFTPDPLIMTTEQKNHAIFYTEEELKIVEKYLIDNEIQFVIKTTNEHRDDDLVKHTTNIKREVKTSILDFI